MGIMEREMLAPSVSQNFVIFRPKTAVPICWFSHGAMAALARDATVANPIRKVALELFVDIPVAAPVGAWYDCQS
jgi:hypothetical protein